MLWHLNKRYFPGALCGGLSVIGVYVCVSVWQREGGKLRARCRDHQPLSSSHTAQFTDGDTEA